MSIILNQVCINEEIRPKYTHTHTHTSIYMYMCVCVCVCVCVFRQQILLQAYFINDDGHGFGFEFLAIKFICK